MDWAINAEAAEFEAGKLAADRAKQKKGAATGKEKFLKRE